jgi:dsDNA-binding SOS-regulon protein
MIQETMSADQGASMTRTTHGADIAENLAGLLQSAERQVKEWLGQREALARRVTELRDAANQLLQTIGEAPSRNSERQAAGARRNKRTMSASQRKAVSTRMRRYWAERRKQSAKL